MRVIFWCSVGFLLYTYAGYPALVMLIARWRRRRVPQAPIEPAVTLIIAAYNEARVLRATIANKLRLDYPRDRLQVIVVSDGSTDGTDAIAQDFAAAGVLLLRQEPRRGKTSALNLAVRRATGDVLVFADANSIYAPDALRMLVRNFADPSVGYVTGQLVYGAAGRSATGAGCRAYMSYEDGLRRSETALGSIVGVNGGVDAVRRSLYVPMRDDHLPDFVLPLQVVARGFRVVYEPDALLYEDSLTAPAAEYRMRVRVALRALWTLAEMRELFNVRRHGLYAVQLLSHKAFRYLAFAALPIAYVAAAALASESRVYAAAAAAGSAFLLLGAAGYVADRCGRSWAVLTLPYYFMLVNAASGHAVVNFLRRRRQAVWAPRLG